MTDEFPGEEEEEQMATSYERLQRAIRILEFGSGTIQERLVGAFRTELQYVGPEGLDETTAYELELVNDEMTKVEAEGDLDTFDMSAASMGDSEAQNLVQQIKAIYGSLSERAEK